MEDNLLIKNAKNGDSESLDLLMKRYKPAVIKVAKKYFIIGADLNDVIQEGMIGLFNAYNNFDEKKNVQFKTFATLCINRQIITAVNSAYKKKIELLDDGEKGSYETTTYSPEDDIILNEEFEILKKEINKKLSSFEQVVLSNFLEDYSYEEIAEKLNLQKKSIDNALSRIRNKLQYLKK